MKNKIMIVDDEKYIRQLYAEELDEEGYQVVTISSGFRIIEKIETENPDLVVLDVRLKDYNGLELLRDIKDRFQDLPVGLCTAYDTFIDDKKSVGADFYIVRSFDLTELKDCIACALDRYRAITPEQDNMFI